MSGYKIVQSRTYDNIVTEPKYGPYTLTFPITVYDAVRAKMDDEKSETLTEALSQIRSDLAHKQNSIPSMPANNIVTYGGKEGVVGSIEITTKMAAALEEESNSKIPTERAVGELLRSLGLITNEGGNTGNTEDMKVIWDAIIDRPTIYDDLGQDSKGLISQKGITDVIEAMQQKYDPLIDNDLLGQFNEHLEAYNPHNVTPLMIGAVDTETFERHLKDYDNPHHITKETLDLDNVDNTADLNKPISKDTQDALDALEESISALAGSMDGLHFVVDMEYKQTHDTLTVNFNDGSILDLKIITNPLIKSIELDKESRVFLITTLGGAVSQIAFDDILKPYTGSDEFDSGDVDVQIDDDNHITAELKPHSVKHEHMDENAIGTENIIDEAVTADKLGLGAVETDRIADNAVTSDKIADRGVTGLDIDFRTITSDNIADGTITGTQIADSSIDAEKMKPVEGSPNTVLGVGDETQSPLWTKVQTDMLADGAVTSGKIAFETIDTDNIKNASIASRKIRDRAVHSQHLSVGIKLEQPALMEHITAQNPKDTLIPDIKWIREEMDRRPLTDENLSDHIVTGSKLFTSEIGHRVLGVIEPNGEAEWLQVDEGMMGDQAVSTSALKDKAVSIEKMGPNSVGTEQLTPAAVDTNNIVDNAVNSAKLFASENPYMVLGVGADGGNPGYTKVGSDMIEDGSIGPNKLTDESIGLDKFAHPGVEDDVLLLYDFEDKAPEWGKLTGKYIEDNSIALDKLEMSDEGGLVLGCAEANTPPVYMKLRSDMIPDYAIGNRHLGIGSVGKLNVQFGAIENPHIAEHAISNRHLAGRLIKPENLFNSSNPFMVLSMLETDPDHPENNNPVWSKIRGEMFENKSIGVEKINVGNAVSAVLGVKDPGQDPEFLKIGTDFIEDKSITTEKLDSDLIFGGTPRIESDPVPESNDKSLATTEWVRQLLDSAGMKPADDIVPTLAEKSVPVENLVPDELNDNMVVGIKNHTTDVVSYVKVNNEMLDPMLKINHDHLSDKSVGENNMMDQSVSGSMIKDGSIQTRHLSDTIELPTNSTTAPSAENVLDEPRVRSIIISSEVPLTAYSGDIWFKYE